MTYSSLKQYLKQFAPVRTLYGHLYTHSQRFRNFARGLPDRAKRRSFPAIRRLLLRPTVARLHGPAKVNARKDELIVVCLVRDGATYVESFIEHYQSLGARHIVFLDNGSEDETVALAREHDGVTVLSSQAPFKYFETAMKQYLIARFGGDNWVLYVDIDEFFDYPYSDRMNLSHLLAYLNRNDYTAIVTQMLDMFSGKPLHEALDDGSFFRETQRFYDLPSITKRDYRNICKGNEITNDDICAHFGGIRDIAFDLDRKPFLTKHALLRLAEGLSAKDFTVHRIKGATLADFSCVLYHYKFVKGIQSNLSTIMKENSQWMNSAQVKTYMEALRKEPDLFFKRSTSEEISSTNELIQNGFLVCSTAYVKWSMHAKAKQKDSVANAQSLSEGLS